MKLPLFLCKGGFGPVFNSQINSFLPNTRVYRTQRIDVSNDTYEN
jgi:hypothetical protein